MNENRKKYVEDCRATNHSILKEKYLLKYERDKHGRPVGVILAFKNEQGSVLVGWSRCNTKMEEFDKQIGIQKAISRAVNPEEIKKDNLGYLPHSMRNYVLDMRERAERYFQVSIKPRAYRYNS